MSSILEALKKLEADKNAQLSEVAVPESTYAPENISSALLGSFAGNAAASQRIPAVLLVMGGGIFTMLLIGVSVLLALFLVQAVQQPSETARMVTAPPAVVVAPAPDVSSTGSANATALEPGAIVEPDPPLQETAAVRRPEVAAKPAAPKPRPPREEPMVSTPVSLPAEVRYEPYVPKPAATAETAGAPLPEDLRTLPMLSRDDSATYGLENIKINMLNEASPTRPLGNALINLEKIFIGETLPGSNARLVDVKSHGIAIEIMSTRQRFYIPRSWR